MVNPTQAQIENAVSRWNAEVKNGNFPDDHRAMLDGTWREIIRGFGGNDTELLGASQYGNDPPPKPEQVMSPDGRICTETKRTLKRSQTWKKNKVSTAVSFHGSFPHSRTSGKVSEITARNGSMIIMPFNQGSHPTPFGIATTGGG